MLFHVPDSNHQAIVDSEYPAMVILFNAGILLTHLKHWFPSTDLLILEVQPKDTF